MQCMAARLPARDDPAPRTGGTCGLRRPCAMLCPAKSEDAKMTRLIAVAVLLAATIAPAFACDWNKSAATDTRSTVASHGGKPAQHGRS
jgi:hypothetical protein